jgi:D-aminopeptidase
MRLLTIFLLCACAWAAVPGAQERRPRARDLGLATGVFEPGPLNAVTDVAGVRVGHVTMVSGDDVRTGVTAILPHDGNIFRDKVAGAVFVGNAFGKLAGSTQVEELGTIETPIVLTNTLAVGAAIEGVVSWTLKQSGNEQVRSVNALVGETNDGGLNDIRGLHVRPSHAVDAIAAARSGAVEEGSVGAGTGTQAFGWKGGIGTASRIVARPTAPRGPEANADAAAGAGSYTLGVLVQSNFGGVLTMGGAPVGKELGRYAFAPRASDAGRGQPGMQADGSCMIVVATDAPLDARDLKRLAARALFGLARTGSSYSNGSGDFAVAFTTSPEMRSTFGDAKPRARTIVPPDAVSPLFQAALEATEEAVYNSLLRATTVESRSGKAEAIPIEKLTQVLRKFNAIR